MYSSLREHLQMKRKNSFLTNDAYWDLFESH